MGNTQSGSGEDIVITRRSLTLTRDEVLREQHINKDPTSRPTLSTSPSQPAISATHKPSLPTSPSLGHSEMAGNPYWQELASMNGHYDAIRFPYGSTTAHAGVSTGEGRGARVVTNMSGGDAVGANGRAEVASVHLSSSPPPKANSPDSSVARVLTRTTSGQADQGQDKLKSHEKLKNASKGEQLGEKHEAARLMKPENSSSTQSDKLQPDKIQPDKTRSDKIKLDKTQLNKKAHLDSNLANDTPSPNQNLQFQPKQETVDEPLEDITTPPNTGLKRSRGYTHVGISLFMPQGGASNGFSVANQRDSLHPSSSDALEKPLHYAKLAAKGHAAPLTVSDDMTNKLGQGSWVVNETGIGNTVQKEQEARPIESRPRRNSLASFGLGNDRMHTLSLILI